MSIEMHLRICRFYSGTNETKEGTCYARIREISMHYGININALSINLR